MVGLSSQGDVTPARPDGITGCYDGTKWRDAGMLGRGGCGLRRDTGSRWWGDTCGRMADSVDRMSLCVGCQVWRLAGLLGCAACQVWPVARLFG